MGAGRRAAGGVMRRCDGGGAIGRGRHTGRVIAAGARRASAVAARRAAGRRRVSARRRAATATRAAGCCRCGGQCHCCVAGRRWCHTRFTTRPLQTTRVNNCFPTTRIIGLTVNQ